MFDYLSTPGYEILWRTGNFKLIGDQHLEGIITLQKPLQKEENSSAKHLQHNTHSEYENGVKTNVEDIFEDEVDMEIDLFGPKLKFEKELERNSVNVKLLIFFYFVKTVILKTFMGLIFIYVHLIVYLFLEKHLYH